MADDGPLLITGASGQLARAVATRVLDAGWPADRLTLVSRSPDALEAFSVRGVVVRYGDFDDAESLRAAFAGARRMLLVSATDLERRVVQHEAAIEAAVAAGVARLVYTSGLAPAPPNPAAVAPSHYATEQRLMAAGVSYTVLRNSLYADYQRSEASQAVRTGRLVHNRGEGRASYVARADCAAAAAAVLVQDGHDNAVYDITGPHAWSAAELASLYGELGGRPVESVAVDDDAFVAGLVGDAREDDHSKYGARLVASFGRAIRESYMASCTDAVERLTGRPAQDLRGLLAASMPRP